MSVNVDGLRAGLRRQSLSMGDRIGSRFVETARGRTSRRSNRLYDSIEATPAEESGDSVIVTITVGVDYGREQDQGSGIYGPDGGRIRAVNGKALRFDWPAAGGIVFFASVAGSPGTRFWSDTVQDFPQIVRSVA